MVRARSRNARGRDLTSQLRAASPRPFAPRYDWCEQGNRPSDLLFGDKSDTPSASGRRSCREAVYTGAAYKSDFHFFMNRETQCENQPLHRSA